MEYVRVHQVGRALEIRYYATNEERERADKLEVLKFPHIRPDSVCVVAVGVNWSPGAWQKTVDMVDKTNQEGVCCWLTEMADTNTHLPGTDVNDMRDCGCLYACDLGFEWVLLVENDILPEPDLLLRLLRPNLPIVVPFIWDNENDMVISYPQHEQNTGLKPVRWAPITCVLIWTKVLNCFPHRMPFVNVAVESSFYGKLLHYGHRAYQDTNTELKVARGPSYTGGKQNLAELWDYWEKVDLRRREMPDRKPINPADTRLVYDPWFKPWVQKGKGVKSEAKE